MNDYNDYLVNINLEPLMVNDDFDTDSDLKIPLAELSVLSSSFASLFNTLNTTVTQLPYPIYRAIDANGNILALNAQIKDGLGAYSNMVGGKIARMEEITSLPNVVSSTIPINPSMLLIATAIMQIENELEDIKEIQQDMYNFLKDAKHAELKGNLVFLSETLNGYKLHWNDDIYKNSAHIKVFDIRQSAEQNIIFYQAQLKRRLAEKKPLTNKSALKAIVSDFEYYRLALYMFAFAYFSEAVLLEKYDREYLVSFSDSIRKRSYEYQSIYSEYYNMLESETDKMLSNKIKSGLAAVGKKLGTTISKIPAISKTQLDEKLIRSSEWLNAIRDSDIKYTLINFMAARETVSAPFLEAIKRIDKFNNEPHEILFDSENIYLREINAA